MVVLILAEPKLLSVERVPSAFRLSCRVPSERDPMEGRTAGGEKKGDESLAIVIPDSAGVSESQGFQLTPRRRTRSHSLPARRPVSASKTREDLCGHFAWLCTREKRYFHNVA